MKKILWGGLVVLWSPFEAVRIIIGHILTGKQSVTELGTSISENGGVHYD